MFNNIIHIIHIIFLCFFPLIRTQTYYVKVINDSEWNTIKDNNNVSSVCYYLNLFC